MDFVISTTPYSQGRGDIAQTQGSGADQLFQRRSVRNHQSRAPQLRELLIAELTQHARDGFAGGTDQLRNLLVRKSNLNPDPILGLLSVAGPLQKQAREFLGNRVREPKGTDHLICTLAVLAQVVRRAETGVGMILKKFQEIVALDEIQLAGLQSLGRQLVGFARNRAMQPQHLSGRGNPEDQGFTVARGRRQLYAPAANDVDTTWCLAFHEQYCSLGKGTGILYFFQVFDRRLRQVTKKSGMAEFA